jgi:hypothetical protein
MTGLHAHGTGLVDQLEREVERRGGLVSRGAPPPASSTRASVSSPMSLRGACHAAARPRSSPSPSSGPLDVAQPEPRLSEQVQNLPSQARPVRRERTSARPRSHAATAWVYSARAGCGPVRAQRAGSPARTSCRAARPPPSPDTPARARLPFPPPPSRSRYGWPGPAERLLVADLVRQCERPPPLVLCVPTARR